MIAALGILLLGTQNPPDVGGAWDNLQWHFARRRPNLQLRQSGTALEGYRGDEEVRGTVDAQGRLTMKYQARFDRFEPKIPSPSVQKEVCKIVPGPHLPGRLALRLDLTHEPRTGALKGDHDSIVIFERDEKLTSEKRYPLPELFVPPVSPPETWAPSFGGIWSFTFPDGDARTLELTQTGNVLKGLIRASGSRTYELEGAAFAGGVIKMVLHLPSKEVKGNAGDVAEVLKMYGDSKRPGHFRTTTWLRHEPSSRKLVGYYGTVLVRRSPATDRPDADEEFQPWELTSNDRLDPAFISPGLADGFSIPNDLREAR